MFYCDECAEKNGWPKSILRRSFGPCEICAKRASCSDVPSSALPMPKKKNRPDDDGDGLTQSISNPMGSVVIPDDTEDRELFQGGGGDTGGGGASASYDPPDSSPSFDSGSSGGGGE